MVKKTVGRKADASMDVSIDWEHRQWLQLANYLQDAAVAPASVPAMIEDEESDHDDDEAAESTVAGKPSEKVRSLRPFSNACRRLTSAKFRADKSHCSCATSAIHRRTQSSRTTTCASSRRSLAMISTTFEAQRTLEIRAYRCLSRR